MEAVKHHLKGRDYNKSNEIVEPGQNTLEAVEKMEKWNDLRGRLQY